LKILLDTNIFIWINSSPEQITGRALALLSDTNNVLFLSMASIWEMQIKTQLGKLKLNASIPELLEVQQRDNDLQILGISLNHIWSLAALPSHHRDPFDRMLIAQAIVEDLALISSDTALDAYPIERFWQ
jgi:PIN domain nuclease of toxin-antitoxin system